jgi:hypothetical protein
VELLNLVLSAWLDNEPVGVGLVLGGLLVLAGVYVGALRPARAHPAAAGTKPDIGPSTDR